MPRCVAIALLTFILLAISGDANAQPCSARVVFSNGILTLEDDAIDARDELRNLVNARLRELGRDELAPYCFDYAYAATTKVSEDDGRWTPALLDFFEAVSQIESDRFGLFWRWIARNTESSLPLMDTLRDIFLAIGNLSYLTNGDLQKQVGQYRSWLSNSGKVIVVAHSQGNLFANDAFSILTSGADGEEPIAAQSFRIVAVATPDAFVAGRQAGTHTTLYGDAILWSLTAAPANTDVDNTQCAIEPPQSQVPDRETGKDCHNFLTSYLAGTKSRARIVDFVVLELAEVAPPPPADTPIARNDAYTVSIGETLEVTAPGILANDTIPNGFESIVFLNPPAGFLDLGDGAFQLTPAAEFTGMVTFTYLIQTSVLNSAAATITVRVNPLPPKVPTSYSVVDLGTFAGGAGSSRAWGVNSSGTVVVGQSDGWSYPGCNETSAGVPFVWTSSGGMQPLGPPPILEFLGSSFKSCGGTALAVGDDGTIVGLLDYGFAARFRPFVWTAAEGMRLIPSGPGSARAVNSAGEVVGEMGGGAFRWTSTGGFESLAIPVQYSSANAINVNGVVGGSAGIESCNTRPEIWDTTGQPRVVDVAGALSGLTPFISQVCSGGLLGINDQLDAVGSFRITFASGGAATVAFKYSGQTDTTMRLQDVPFEALTDSEAADINNQGIVVGTKDNLAFVWTEATGFKELGAMIGASASDWTLWSASAISETGLIVGSGTYEGRQRAYMLVPTP